MKPVIGRFYIIEACEYPVFYIKLYMKFRDGKPFLSVEFRYFLNQSLHEPTIELIVKDLGNKAIIKYLPRFLKPFGFEKHNNEKIKEWLKTQLL